MAPLRTPASSSNSRTTNDQREPSIRNTPFARRRSLLLAEHQLQEFEIERIYNKYLSGSFKLNRVSPLYNFQYSSTARRRYESELLEIITASEKCAPEFGNDDMEVKVSIAIIKKLRTQESRQDAISLRIKSICQTTHQEKLVYQCVICSLNTSEVDLESDKFVVLPLMLWKGPLSLKELVNKFLMQTFKCSIWAITFRPVDLEWMVAMYAVNEQSPSNLHLTYCSSIPELNTFAYILDESNVNTIVRSVVAADAAEITWKQVLRVMNMVKKHLFYLTNVDFNSLYLQAIKTANIDVNQTSQVRLKNHKCLLQILGFLTDFAERLLHHGRM